MSNYSTLHDDVLMKLIRANDELAFTEMYNRYWEKLLAIAFHYTHDRQAAEDVLQEVMLSFWQRRGQVQIDSPSAYLATAIKFSVFKYIARLKRQKQIKEGILTVAAVNDVEDQLEAKFLQALLTGEIEQFSEKTGLIFAYRQHDDLSVKEIAGKMDLSPKSIEYHLSKAMHLLRSRIKKFNFFV